VEFYVERYQIGMRKSSTLCRCGNPRRSPGQADCAACHAAYLKRWRKKHPMPARQKKRANIRRVSGMLVKRGKIKPGPCFKCGGEATERHHPNYKNPRAFYWLCAPCHRAIHATGEKLPALRAPAMRPYNKGRSGNCGCGKPRVGKCVYCRDCRNRKARELRKRNRISVQSEPPQTHDDTRRD
jgi:hypothetical protein